MPRPEYVLNINVAGSRYLNIETSPHLDLVIVYNNASKTYAAAKEVHESWTVLVTTATTN